MDTTRVLNRKGGRKHNRPALKQLRGRKKLIGCEIGVQYGNNAEWILKALSIKKLYLIDPYSAYVDGVKSRRAKIQEGIKNMTVRRLLRWEKEVVWLFDRSDIAYRNIPDGELDFVYIDGLHDYESVKNDILLFEKKVRAGGLICGHDYNLRGVKKAVNEIYGDRVKIAVCNNIGKKRVHDWWVWKDGKG